jgi:hypothetical protein
MMITLFLLPASPSAPVSRLQVLSRKLDSPVSVPVYSSHAAALTGGSAAGECFLASGDRAMLWLGPVPEDKLPKDAQGKPTE